MYGDERARELASRHWKSSPAEMVRAYVEDLRAFTSNAASEDDVTIMAIQRVR